MKTKLLFSILLVSLVMVLFGQNVGPKMCKVCGKPFAQCQHRGKHPQMTSDGVLTCNGVSYKMICVEGGTFMMGATSEQSSDAFDNEKPAHQVTLSTFSIGATEVTQELWMSLMGSNPSSFKGPKRPVENVSWKDCQEFIKKLNAETGKTFRLPTEAEWEYAARGGNRSRGYPYSGSNILEDVAWYASNSGRKTHIVATKKPNEIGLYDMCGNVYEWCQDWYGRAYYTISPKTNPKGDSKANSWNCRVIRSSTWGSDARECRSSCRTSRDPTDPSWFLGFRLVLSE